MGFCIRKGEKPRCLVLVAEREWQVEGHPAAF